MENYSAVKQSESLVINKESASMHASVNSTDVGSAAFFHHTVLHACKAR